MSVQQLNVSGGQKNSPTALLSTVPNLYNYNTYLFTSPLLSIPLEQNNVR